MYRLAYHKVKELLKSIAQTHSKDNLTNMAYYLSIYLSIYLSVLAQDAVSTHPVLESRSSF